MKRMGLFKAFSISVIVVSFGSCAAPTYLPPPPVKYSILESTYTFGVQNMDETAKVESEAMTCHYDGFDVQYKINSDMSATFVVVNNSNKSLIIDKSKCFVLYDGYSNQLFKEVRSSRSTTFNNVQDAINNVQTNEGSVSMSIPPYSKWALPIQETNVRSIQKLPISNYSEGRHQLSPYDNQEIVEFVIPYSYDYSLANWKTCRNRIFVNSVDVKNIVTTSPSYNQTPLWISNNQYRTSVLSRDGIDYSEANRIDAINRKRYKKHNRQVHISHALWGIPLIPTVYGILYMFTGCWNDSHEPPTYGNGGSYSNLPSMTSGTADPFGGFFNQ